MITRALRSDKGDQNIIHVPNDKEHVYLRKALFSVVFVSFPIFISYFE